MHSPPPPPPPTACHSDRHTTLMADVPQSPAPPAPGAPRLIITEMVLENFKSYAGAQHVGPFHKARGVAVPDDGRTLGPAWLVTAAFHIMGAASQPSIATYLPSDSCCHSPTVTACCRASPR